MMAETAGNSLRTASYWLPPVALEVLSFLRQSFRYRHLRSHLQRNAAFKNRFAGEAVYVVANGPSLNNFGPHKLRGRKVIVMNHFELAPWKNDVEVVAHCIGEPFDSPAWEDPTASITGTSAQSYWMHISALQDPAVRACVQSKPLHFVQAIVKPDLWGNRQPDLIRSSLGYQTTAQLAISVALFLGFKTIYLVGFDHDWLSTRGHSPHFYAADADVPPADLSRFTYHEMISISDRMWRFYFALAAAAQAAGAKIINLSQPSYLDVFPTGPRPPETLTPPQNAEQAP